MKILLITIVLLLTISIPASAEDAGIHGNIQLNQELQCQNFAPQTWSVELYYRFNLWLQIGVSEATNTNNIDTKGSFIPTSQMYEAYIGFNIGDNINFKLSQWCLHSTYSGLSDPGSQFVYQGIRIRAEYKF